MSQQRIDYFTDLVADAGSSSQDPEVISAIILSDALNGIRKALLEVSENLRLAAVAQNDQVLNLAALVDVFETYAQEANKTQHDQVASLHKLGNAVYHCAHAIT